ncbi:15-hydroxyprostaglandin dehydrogenase [Trichonephila clavipes]|nr:15-hydroxyprostaglandin dehydrogenase [Trichonephila clavipes]
MVSSLRKNLSYQAHPEANGRRMTAITGEALKTTRPRIHFLNQWTISLRQEDKHQMLWIDTLCCPEADGPTNLEQPTLNHVQSDTMASAVLVDLTRALQGTNRGSGPAMEKSENDVGSLEQLLLYADEHYLSGKLPWETI